MAKENILKVRADDDEKGIIELIAKKRGQSVSLYLLEQGLLPSRVVAQVDDSVKTDEELENERQLKELIDFVGVGNLLDKLQDITKSRSDVKKWGWALMERLSGPAIQTTGVSSGKIIENKWEGWEIQTNPDGEKAPYYSEYYNDNVISVAKGTKTQVIKEGEDGWDYFINQLQ